MNVRTDFGEVGTIVLPAENNSETVGAHPTHLTCKVHKEELLQARMSTGVSIGFWLDALIHQICDRNDLTRPVKTLRIW